MKLNKTRQKLYLDGKVGLINDGTVEQLREVCRYGMFKGDVKYYTQKHHGHKEQFNDIEYHPISWFYENETELPKKVRVDKANDGWYDTEIGNVFNVISEEDNKYFVEHPLNTEYLNHFIHISACTPINDCTPTSYKLKIDIPEWVLKAGDEIESGRLPRSIMEYIAIPIYTQPFTLENGTEIELTNNDIDKIKKM